MLAQAIHTHNHLSEMRFLDMITTGIQTHNETISLRVPGIIEWLQNTHLQNKSSNHQLNKPQLPRFQGHMHNQETITVQCLRIVGLL